MRNLFNRILPVGPRSVLWGAHCWFIHPWFVALAWWRLYGFPRDPRLWVAFFVHDIGYALRWCPNMDGPEGEAHPLSGAMIMFWLFDWRKKGKVTRKWFDFTVYHSRFMAKKSGVTPSPLCAADKLAVALEPWWFYLPRVLLSGEIWEYLEHSKAENKYGTMNLLHDTQDISTYRRLRVWFQRTTAYMRDWAYTHADGRPDTWTPDPNNEEARMASLQSVFNYDSPTVTRWD
jgi:hypothetical protein